MKKRCCFLSDPRRIRALPPILVHPYHSKCIRIFPTCPIEAKRSGSESDKGKWTYAVVLAYLCIVSINASMYLLFASVLGTPLCASHASHLSLSLFNSSPSTTSSPDCTLKGRSITPSTSPSIACLYNPYRRSRSDGGGRDAPVLGIFFTVFRACTNTRSANTGAGQSVRVKFQFLLPAKLRSVVE